MTDIPALIERLHAIADGADIREDQQAEIREAAEALSRLTAYPLPGEIAGLIVRLNRCVEWTPGMDKSYVGAHCRQAIAALEQMAREIGADKVGKSILQSINDGLMARIRELEAERDELDKEWHRVVHERDAIRAKTFEECLEALGKMQGRVRGPIIAEAMAVIRALASPPATTETP